MLAFCTIVICAPVENITEIEESNTTVLTSTKNPLLSSTESKITTTTLKIKSSSEHIYDTTKVVGVTENLQRNETTLTTSAVDTSTSAELPMSSRITTPYHRGYERNNDSTMESTITTSQTTR